MNVQVGMRELAVVLSKCPQDTEKSGCLKSCLTSAPLRTRTPGKESGFAKSIFNQFILKKRFRVPPKTAPYVTAAIM